MSGKLIKKVPLKGAGIGFHADFKPSLTKRTIRHATAKQVKEASAPILKEFSGAFKILAK
jgi:hypothetical protein